MEFWGVEVKAGQSLKIKPESYKQIHLTKISLGEVKDGEGPKNVPVRLKIDGKDSVIGYLVAEKGSQVNTDLVFQKEFEISHGWKDGSVYLMGYTCSDSDLPDIDDEDMSDSDSDLSISDDDLPVTAPENGHAEPKPVTTDVAESDDDDDSGSDEVDESGDDSKEETDALLNATVKQGPIKTDDESPSDSKQESSREEESSGEEGEEEEPSGDEDEAPQALKKRDAAFPKVEAPSKKAKVAK